jgi:DNA-binding transcriptional ArsR family regulator
MLDAGCCSPDDHIRTALKVTTPLDAWQDGGMDDTAAGKQVDMLQVEDARVLAALSHPTRHALWVALGERGATTSQLTRRLGINKGNVAHHLRVLVNAGLVRWGESRTVRGGTEVYAHRSASQLRFAAGTNRAAERAMLTQVTDEVLRARNPLVRHRHLQLTPPQARALRDHLDRLATEEASSGPREREYGLLVSLYDVR